MALATGRGRFDEVVSRPVRVVVRVRPPISIESGHGTGLLQLDPAGRRVHVGAGAARGPGGAARGPGAAARGPGAAAVAPRAFAVDAVLGPGASQEEVYVTAGVEDMVAAVVAGYNATVFAYGQVLLVCAARCHVACPVYVCTRVRGCACTCACACVFARARAVALAEHARLCAL